VSPAHSAGQRRWLVVVVVVLVLVGLGVAARVHGTSLPGGPPLAPPAQAGAADAESSAWYCTGQTTASGQLASGSVILTNTGRRTISGTIHGVTDTGATASRRISVGGDALLVTALPAPKSGTWLSEAVTLSGGGVAVSQTVHGAAGWAEAPCQSSTSQQWYFPSGSTTGANSLFIALFNPTSTPDVVDLSFVTRKGVMHPINFQGLVLPPGQTQVESIAPFVQDQSSVATTVTTRTGRLVAGELELFAAAAPGTGTGTGTATAGATGTAAPTGTGMAIVPGSPRAEQEWISPQNMETANGTSTLDIFNPGPTAQVVTVRARLGSGPLSPFRSTVPADTTWVLSTGTETRIPPGDPYSLIVRAHGGAGIVVGRTVGAPSSALAPQDGMITAVDALTAAAPSRRWVVPPPGSAAVPATAGAAPAHLALTNVAGHRETYRVEVTERTGSHSLASGHLDPGRTITLGRATLARAGLHPLRVQAGGATAVAEDVGPAGTYGVVTMPGIPLSLDRAN
jgi:Family of unknown function (DUF5719)